MVGERHRFLVAFDHETTIACASLFVISAAVFVFASYPEQMTEMMEDVQKNVSQLSYMQRYFTGRYEMLLMRHILYFD